MINYRFYAFKMALEEIIAPNKKANRVHIYQTHIPDDVKENISDIKNSKDKFFETIERYKKLGKIIGFNKVWNEISPLGTDATSALEEIDDNIKKTQKIIDENEYPEFKNDLQYDIDRFKKQEKYKVNELIESVESPIYDQIIDLLEHYQRIKTPLLPEHKENIPKQWKPPLGNKISMN